MTETRQRLIDGALETLRDKGMAATSARTIAAAASANQGLIFYHFGSVDQLIIEACRVSTEQRVQHYRQRFAAVGSLRELLGIGRELHATELAAGNVTVLAQVVAGAQQNEAFAAAGREAIEQWIAEIERVLRRLLRGSPIAPAVDQPGLARGIAAAFIGIELYDGVDAGGAQAALAALEQLSVLAEVLDDLGPVARRAVRSRVRKAQARTPGPRPAGAP